MKPHEGAAVTGEFQQHKEPTMRNIQHIVVHSSFTPPDMDIGASEIREWHTSPPNNWSDIGYHYVIRRDGGIEQGRPEDKPGAHVKNNNSFTLGVCIIGGKAGNSNAGGEFNFTPQQMESLEGLLDDLNRKYPTAEICGHRDLDTTRSCPYWDVKAWAKELFDGQQDFDA